MNNPVPKYFDHPDKFVRFLEWESLKRIHFSDMSTSIYEAYSDYDQSWGHWSDHFYSEIKKIAYQSKT